MRGVNKAIIIGSVGKDPEVRATASGDCIVNLSVATSESWKDKQGNKQESTEWHRVSAFGKLAEIIRDYVVKGSKVYIEGKIKTRSYDKDGVKVYVTEIVANELQMLDSKGESSQSGYKRMDGKPELQQQQAPQFDDSENIPF